MTKNQIVLQELSLWGDLSNLSIRKEHPFLKWENRVQLHEFLCFNYPQKSLKKLGMNALERIIVFKLIAKEDVHSKEKEECLTPQGYSGYRDSKKQYLI